MRTIRLRTTLITIILFLCAIDAASSQQAPPSGGRILGRVTDAATERGVAAVAVHVVGTSRGTISGADGRFVIDNVPAGSATLQATSLGYTTRAIPIEVRAGAVTEQDIALQMEAVAVAGLEVSAAQRGSVERALQQQREAVGLVNTATAEQITRSPDSDAAQAVQRMSGATVQDGKFVVVRGLGERYTTTSLNGARVPSAEPERRLVPLDIFPSALLEQITTAKTFTPDQSGDFSGASVDITTRAFPLRGLRSLSASFGFNPTLTGKSAFFAPASGNDWLALGAAARTPLGAADVFRNVWSPQNARAIPNGSIAFTLGGSRELSQTRQVGYVVSGTYSAAREVQSDQVRAQAQAAGEETVEIDRYEGSTTRQSVLWGGIANFSTLLSGHSRIALNNTYNRSADNEARLESGVSENYGNLALDLTRLRYVERAVRSHQLSGTHEIGSRGTLDWSVSTSAVTRREPDRSEIVYAHDLDPQTGERLPAAWFATAAEGAVRTFGDLSESAWEMQTNLAREVGRSTVKLGASLRHTKRDAQNEAYSITAPLLPRAERAVTPEQIFAATDDRFRTAPLSQGGSYHATDRLLGGYALLDWGPSERLRISAGARLELSDVRVVTEPTVGSEIETNPAFADVLPSLALNYRPRDNQVVKFSATQTLSRPEYRELAGVQYREVLGGDNVIGNPELRRTLIRNLDVRYELYPAAGELISVAAFAKFFEDPIERVYLGTSGTRVVTYLNADGARNYGIEIEGRKRIGSLTAFANATVMRSEIAIGDAASGASRINDERPMVGQSPYVVNAGVTWQPAWGLDATALYNVFGKRIVSAAELPLPDVYELPRQALDISLRMPVGSAVTAKLDLKNILDQRHETVQGTTVRETYRTGRVVSLGVQWQQ